MGTVHKNFRIDAQTLQELTKKAELLGIPTEKEAIEDALKHFIKCDKAPQPQGPKLIRSPIETNCGNCPKKISYGAWCYMDPKHQEALCLDCAVERGYTDKQRVKQILDNLEHRANIKAMKKRERHVAKQIMEAEQKLKLYDLGKRHQDIELKIVELTDLGLDLLKNKIGTDEEKKALKKLENCITASEKIQAEARELIQKILFKDPTKVPRKKKEKKEIDVV